MAGWIVLALWTMAGSSDGGPATFEHVRSAEPAVRTLIAEGYRQSPTFKAIVDRIEALPCVVYVGTAARLSQGMRGALLHSPVGLKEMPVLRVLLRANLSRDEAISVIAHELQHVTEAMAHTRDGGELAMTVVFASLDQTATGRDVRRYETDEAMAVTVTVRDELRVASRQPVVSR
jgi:hypothetical protein